LASSAILDAIISHLPFEPGEGRHPDHTQALVRPNPIFSALGDGDMAKARAIIEAGPRAVNARSKDGFTPLAEIAAEPNPTNATISTRFGLHGALKLEEDEKAALKVPLVAELLMAKGADVNAADIDGFAPLHFASALGKYGLAELLIAKGAHVDAKVTGGKTPLFIALEKRRFGVAKLLIRKGADVNISVGQGAEAYTPLQVTAGLGDLDTVTALLAAGAKLEANPGPGTPLSWVVASKRGENQCQER
jgi:ankyrin repeat protein